MNWEIINTVVSIIQIIVSILLILSVLMQSAKKEGMEGIIGGASETFFGKNKGRTLDSKFAIVTTVSAIIFLVSSLVLSYGMLRTNKDTTTVPEQQYTDIVNDELEAESDVADDKTETPDTVPETDAE